MKFATLPMGGLAAVAAVIGITPEAIGIKRKSARIGSTLRKQTPLSYIGNRHRLQRANPRYSKRDLGTLPDPVIDLFGFALYFAQNGGKHEQARPLRGFGSAAVLEVVEDWNRGTYRSGYTPRFSGTIFVLHVFQKKSKRGAATPRSLTDAAWRF